MNQKPNNLKQPVAPPVYRPQPVPRVLQTKRLPGQNMQPGRPPVQPVVPAVFRPEVKKIVQPQAISAQRQSPIAPAVYRPEQKQLAQFKMAGSAQMKTQPVAPPVHRPQPVPMVLQTKKQVGPRQPAHNWVATPSSSPGAIQRSRDASS